MCCIGTFGNTFPTCQSLTVWGSGLWVCLEMQRALAHRKYVLNLFEVVCDSNKEHVQQVVVRNLDSHANVCKVAACTNHASEGQKAELENISGDFAFCAFADLEREVGTGVVWGRTLAPKVEPPLDR